MAGEQTREENIHRLENATRGEDGREDNVDKPSMMRFWHWEKGSLAYMILSVSTAVKYMQSVFRNQHEKKQDPTTLRQPQLSRWDKVSQLHAWTIFHYWFRRASHPAGGCHEIYWDIASTSHQLSPSRTEHFGQLVTLSITSWTTRNSVSARWMSTLSNWYALSFTSAFDCWSKYRDSKKLPSLEMIGVDYCNNSTIWGCWSAYGATTRTSTPCTAIRRVSSVASPKCMPFRRWL